VKRGARADSRSDLYAVGVVLGEQLGHGDPDRVARLVDSLTETDPAARPRDAGQALELITHRPVVVHTEQNAIEGEDDYDYEEPTSIRELPPRAPRRRPSTGSFPLPPPSEPSRDRPWGVIAGGIVGVLLVAALAFALLGGGDDEGGSMGDRHAAADKKGGKEAAAAAATTADPVTSTTTTTEQAPAEEESTSEDAPESSGGLPAPDPTPNPEEGAALNAKGKQLIDSGDPAAAVPILAQAVADYPADSTDVEYGYALFNYAQALRLSGDPAAAIPVLERRLQIDDQIPAVKAELKLAKQQAG
jgi:hypothetical protein